MMRRTPLARKTALSSSPDKVRDWNRRSAAKSTSTRRRRAISPASAANRAAVKGRSCIVCGDTPVDPAHLVSRSVCPEGADDGRAVVALCRAHHRAYDDGNLSVLEYIEPHHRAELAFAVERFGLVSTLEFVTKSRWAPVDFHPPGADEAVFP